MALERTQEVDEIVPEHEHVDVAMITDDVAVQHEVMCHTAEDRQRRVEARNHRESGTALRGIHGYSPLTAVSTLVSVSLASPKRRVVCGS